MKFVIASIFIVLVVHTTRCTAFFGSKYNVPQSAAITKTSNAIIANLQKSDRALHHFKTALPQNADYLKNGADALTQLIQNLIEQVVPVYQALSTSVTDKTTKTTYQFIVILESIEASITFLSNDSLPLVDAITSNFGQSNTTAFISSSISNLASEMVVLQTNVKSIKKSVVAASATKPAQTATQLLAAVGSKLNSIIASLSKVSATSSKVVSIIPNLVSAIESGNNFHGNLNNEISEAQSVITNALNDYVSTSTKTLSQWSAAITAVLTYAGAINNTFLFEQLPYDYSGTRGNLDSALIDLNSTLYKMWNDYNGIVQSNTLRFANIKQSIVQSAAVFSNINQTATRVYYSILDVLNPNECVANFPNTIVVWPAYFANYLKSTIVPNQLANEKRVLTEIVNVINNLIKADITLTYKQLEVCLSSAVTFSAQTCLDSISSGVILQMTKISQRSSLLPMIYSIDATASMGNFAQQSANFIQNGGLDATCFSSAA